MMRSGPATPTSDRSGLVCRGLLLAALVGAIVTRLMIWFPRGEPSPFSAERLMNAFGSMAPDLLALLLLLAALALAEKLLSPRLRKARHWAVAIAAVLLFVAMVANLMSMQVTRAPLDPSWLGYVNARDADTSMAMVRAATSRNRLITLAALLVVMPLIALLLCRLFERLFSVRFMLFGAALLTGPSALFAYHSEQAGDPLGEKARLGASVVKVSARALMPSRSRRALNGERIARATDAEAAVARDFAPPSAELPPACCAGFNIVHITIDSVARPHINRAHVLAPASGLPNLARLYRDGLAFTQAMANRPSSDAALAIMASSSYPPNWYQSGDKGLLGDRASDGLGQAAVQKGYVAAQFMSGQANFAGLGVQLRRWGFATVKGSRDTSCSPDDAALIARYSHAGDDCTARAAVKWLEAHDARPFYLWVWFTNPHTPYYNRDDPFARLARSDKERHAQAVRDTDAALGKLLDAIEARADGKRTIILLSGDHGEAFGEHGLIYHATGLFEEQIGIPLVIKAEGLQGGKEAHEPVSLLDFAPTLAHMAGLPVSPRWMGASVFAHHRPERFYFGTIFGGRAAGYREGSIKYQVHENRDGVLRYDLARDPGERSPVLVDGAEEAVALARIAAFVRVSDAAKR